MTVGRTVTARFTANIESLQGVSAPPALPPLPALLVNAVITSLGRTLDGDLIELVEPPWRALVERLAKDPDARFQIPHRKLEEIVAASYRDAGFDEVWS